MRSSSVDFYILETLREEHSHLSSHEVFEQIQKQLPAVNPSTVYRALDRLVKCGKVSVSDMGTGAEVYELAEGEIHHHIVCQGCGKIITLCHEDVDPFFATLERKTGFHIVTNHLVLFGECADCQKKRIEAEHNAKE
jgi:Fur family ferric uptake transcriptional regulator